MTCWCHGPIRQGEGCTVTDLETHHFSINRCVWNCNFKSSEKDTQCTLFEVNTDQIHPRLWPFFSAAPFKTSERLGVETVSSLFSSYYKSRATCCFYKTGWQNERRLQPTILLCLHSYWACLKCFKTIDHSDANTVKHKISFSCSPQKFSTSWNTTKHLVWTVCNRKCAWSRPPNSRSQSQSTTIHSHIFILYHIIVFILSDYIFRIE